MAYSIGYCIKSDNHKTFVIKNNDYCKIKFNNGKIYVGEAFIGGNGINISCIFIKNSANNSYEIHPGTNFWISEECMKTIEHIEKILIPTEKKLSGIVKSIFFNIENMENTKNLSKDQIFENLGLTSFQKYILEWIFQGLKNLKEFNNSLCKVKMDFYRNLKYSNFEEIKDDYLNKYDIIILEELENLYNKIKILRQTLKEISK